MAQDYDSPRSKDEDEESLQALGKSSQNASNDMDDDENAIAEDYELPGADLVTTAHVELGPFQRALVPTGVRIALPAGYVGLVHPRSGLAVKQGVTVLNAPGTIDAGYRGEIKVPLINLDPEHTAVFEPGDRIAQLVIQRYVQAEFIEASVLPGSDRAERGFGSSGV